MIPTPESLDSLAFQNLCGQKFSEGMHRTVHNVNGFPNLVMKVSKNGNTFANWCEYLVSNALSGRSEPITELIGEVKTICATGTYLIMERLNDINSISGVAYPIWLNDKKPSNFGQTCSGTIKIRDYGMLKLDDVLAQYFPKFDEEVSSRIITSGNDEDYEALLGKKIGNDAGRCVHEVKGKANHIIKVCIESHRPNRVEMLVWCALSDMNAFESSYFGNLECSRSGKYLLMEKLKDLPPNFTGVKPQLPYWLMDTSDACLGMTIDGTIKIRSYSDILLGDVLAKARLLKFPHFAT